MTTVRPRRKQASRRIDLTVVGGAGHVGLPLALVFAAKGLRVMIHDVNRKALTTIRSGRLPAIEYGAEPLLKAALRRGWLEFSHRPQDIPATGAVIVTIGTPVDEFLNPVHKAVRQCLDGLLPHLADGQLLILRSTVYPGTTDWLDGYLKKQGRQFKVAFCPERVVQGHSVRELQEMPQIISGTSREAENEAAALFERIAPEVVRVTPMEAEFAKLFTNTYRYIQFATTNQFYMMAARAGVDYFRIVDAMTRHYPRMRGFPTAGFAAGPCLFKDTMQLSAFATNEFALGHAAMHANEGLVLFIVEELRRRFDLGHATVGLLGMAFKAESDDIRSSLSYKLKKMLALHAERVLTTDPLVRDDPDLKPLARVIKDSDVLVLCTPHAAYRDLDLKGKPVIDVWGFFR
jgi:UDP-N-acetyl-D-mannosaminuronic acid dehydrogenase